MPHRIVRNVTRLRPHWLDLCLLISLFLPPLSPVAGYLVLCTLAPALAAWQLTERTHRSLNLPWPALAPLAGLVCASAVGSLGRPDAWPGIVWLMALVCVITGVEFDPTEDSRKRLAWLLQLTSLALASVHLWRYITTEARGELWYQELRQPIDGLSLSIWRWPELAVPLMLAGLPFIGPSWGSIPRARWMAALTACLLIAGTLTASLVAGGLALAVGLVCVAPPGRRLRAAVAGAVGICIIGAALTLSRLGMDKTATAQALLSAAQTRSYALHTAKAVIADAPLIGCGLGRLPAEHGPHRPHDATEPFQAVAQPPSISPIIVTWCAETGLVGLLAAVWFALDTLRRARRPGSLGLPEMRSLIAALAAVLTYALLTGALFTAAGGVTLAALLGGIRANDRRNASHGHEAPAIQRKRLPVIVLIAGAAGLILALIAVRYGKPGTRLIDRNEPDEVTAAGLLDVAEGRSEEAVEDFQRATLLYPAHFAALKRQSPPRQDRVSDSLHMGALAWDQLGRWHRSRGDLESAEACQAAAEQLDAQRDRLRMEYGPKEMKLPPLKEQILS